MSASPPWLEEMARVVARRQLRAAAPDGSVAEWGARRFSRRTTIGTAATAVAAVSALRHVTPALAQGPPACVKPCLDEAARNRDGSYDQAARDDRIFSAPLNGERAGLQAQLGRTKSKAKRAKIQARINRINQLLGQAVMREILDQFNADRNFENNRRRCLSSGECGDPAKYPGGAPANPGTPDGSATSCTADARPCNCGGDVKFLCCLKFFTCGECCG